MCTRRFDAVRASLTNQVTAAYIRRTGVKSSLLAQSLATLFCFALILQFPRNSSAVVLAM